MPARQHWGPSSRPLETGSASRTSGAVHSSMRRPNWVRQTLRSWLPSAAKSRRWPVSWRTCSLAARECGKRVVPGRRWRHRPCADGSQRRCRDGRPQGSAPFSEGGDAAALISGHGMARRPEPLRGSQADADRIAGFRMPAWAALRPHRFRSGARPGKGVFTARNPQRLRLKKSAPWQGTHEKKPAFRRAFSFRRRVSVRPGPAPAQPIRTMPHRRSCRRQRRWRLRTCGGSCGRPRGLLPT